MRALFLYLAFSLAAYSQVVRFGVKGGIPFGAPTADFGYLKIHSDHWTVGPTIEFRLPAHLGLEIGGLYSSYTVRYPSVAAPGSTQGSPVSAIGDTHAWDVPAALKYRILDRRASPFILGGVNYRRESSDVRTTCLTPGGRDCATSAYSTSQDRLGPLFGGGVEWPVGRLRLAPEFRYTRLNRTGANQYMLLFGLSF